MTYVVLAAGTARRMGFDKIFTPLAGKAPLERLARVLEGRRAIAVVPPARRADAARMAPAFELVENGEPRRGMTHSLRAALTRVGGDEDFAVLLADKPFVRLQTLALLEARIEGCDVVYPTNAAGEPGHPVLFSHRARALALALPDGDTLWRVRDDPSLRACAVRVDDPGAFADLDEPSQWTAADA
jgi:molybdenum cofactor cytidylyltransferase